MIKDKIQILLDKYKVFSSNRNFKQAWILFWFQVAVIGLLLGTVVLIYQVDVGDRLGFYFSLLATLIFVLCIALVTNLLGQYKVSAWITIACILFGPWASFLFDRTVVNGDLIPLIYTVLTVNFCALFLSERVTLFIAAAQLIALIYFIQSNPALLKQNWPSLLTFVVFTAVIGMVTSILNRKQLEQIEDQKAQLLEDEAQLRELLIRDSLTGLYNRRYMQQILESEISRIETTKQSVGIIMLDVDNFKTINDSYGHVFGDSVLVKVAMNIIANISDSDVACRFGGDEMVIIRPNCSLENTFIKAEEIRNAISNITIKNEGKNPINITVSVGVATLNEAGVRGEDGIIAADKALYMAKKEGRNRVVASKGV